jgi:acetoin utilization protein AcuB
MIASELITDGIPPLKTSDTAERALAWMGEFRVNHLPIVNNREFLGLISEEDIIDLNAPAEVIGAHSLSLIKPYVLEDAHIYEVINLINEQKLTIVPVLNHTKTYLGLISLQDLLENFAMMTSVEGAGGILVLELGVRDYSLAEIARIIEGDGARILSTYITSHQDSTKLELTLKIDKDDLTYIINSLVRFKYKIKGSYHINKFLDDTVDRYESLMKYLNI